MFVKPLSKAEVTAHLAARGFNTQKAANIVASFDWSVAVYLRTLQPGERLVQYGREPWGGVVEGRAFNPARVEPLRQTGR